MMFDGMHDGWMWGMHWAWWTFWVLFVLLVLWFIIRRSSSGAQTPAERETPLEILQRRYAEGEISTEEYEDRKARLQES